MGRLENKVALVTGGGSGIGRGSALALAAEGAKVLVTDIDVEGGEATVAQIEKAGGVARFAVQDVVDEARWAEIVALAVESFGGLHILLNNAGIAIGAPITEMSLEDWRLQTAINIDGVFLGCKHAYKPMKAAGGGSIVNISSASSLKGLMPDLSLYSASKGAVRSYSKAVALEYVKDGIRVNTVHPGLVATTLNKEYLADPELRRTMLGNTMFDRPGECEEMAEMVAFLASDAASYMTGADIAVDGGWTAN